MRRLVPVNRRRSSSRCCASLYADAGLAQPARAPRRQRRGSPAPAADQAVQSVQAFYDKSTTFKSDFSRSSGSRPTTTRRRRAATSPSPSPARWTGCTTTRRTTASSPTARSSGSTRPATSRCSSSPSTRRSTRRRSRFSPAPASSRDSFDFQLFPGDRHEVPRRLRPRRHAQARRRPRTRRCSSTSTRARRRSGG